METKLTHKQAAVLGTLFTEAAMFASSDFTRPILTGVLCTSRDGKLSLVATDSYALAIFSTTATDAPAGFRVNVAALELAAIGKALAKLKPAYASDDRIAVTLTFGDRELIAECDAWRMSAPIIEGDYPNYEQLVPVGDGNADSWPRLSVKYLTVFGKVRCARDVAGKLRHSLGLRVETFGELKPCRITASSEHAEMLALLMPVRT